MRHGKELFLSTINVVRHLIQRHLCMCLEDKLWKQLLNPEEQIWHIRDQILDHKEKK